jgi:LysR family glycine cleavage system transcriptional activator
MRQMPNLRALQIFESAARLSSFLHAAKELNVTPSAVSHQIRLLESDLGVVLFHRVNRSVVLTDAGSHYLEVVGNAFGRLEAASHTVGRMSASDILTISIAPSLATKWLMPRLWDFTDKHTDIDVRILATGAPLSDLRGGTIDIDIRYGSILREAAMITHAFPKERIVAFCSPNIITQDTPLAVHADIRHHALIHSEVNLFRWANWVQEFCSDALDVSRGPRFDRSFLSIEAAVAGRGICLESMLLVEKELAEGTLVMPFSDLGPEIDCHYITYLRSRARLPKIQAFRDWLLTNLTAKSVGPSKVKAL